MACEMPVNLIATKTLQFYSQSLELGAIVIVSNVVIGGFSEKGLKWLGHATVQLQPTVRLHCPIKTFQII